MTVRHEQKLEIDWGGIDFQNRTVKSIALELGVKPNVVYQHRKLLCPELKHSPGRKPAVANPAEMDFQQTNKTLAERYKCSPKWIQKQRAKYDPNSQRVSSQRKLETVSDKARTDWQKVDWSLRNSELASLYGVSKQAVNQARSRWGVPWQDCQHRN